MTDSNPSYREPFDYELPPLFQQQLESCDPVATLEAQLEHGVSARVSYPYDRLGHPVSGPSRTDGFEDAWFDDPWFDDPETPARAEDDEEDQ